MLRNNCCAGWNASTPGGADEVFASLQRGISARGALRSNAVRFEFGGNVEESDGKERF